MRKYCHLLVLGVFTLVLAACESAPSESVSVSRNDSEFPLSATPPEGTDPLVSGRLAAAPGLREIPDFPPPSDRDLRVITNKLAGGAVELYGLEDDGDAFTPSAPAPLRGIQAVNEPNVTVYPLDDTGAYPGQYPPVHSWPIVPVPLSLSSESFDGEGDADPSAPTVYFSHGSSSLSAKDAQVIAKASEKAKFAPVSRVRVEGHASARAESGDPVKDSILNLKESMNRAFEVSKAMMLNGVPAEKIKTTAWGDTKPFLNDAAGDAEAKARRVDIITGAE